MKFPYLRHLGRQDGWNRVGPLARLNVCDSISTPLANEELREFKAYTNGKPNNHTMHTHWARLIEVLHCAESIRDLLHDKEILDVVERPKVNRRPEGIGIIEAPRGTLMHHYKADEKGAITKCNLIVSTTHNNEPMNRAVQWVAQNVLDQQKEITEGMLNQVEVAIRAYDPCLSCATHAMGQMPLILEVLDAGRQGDCRARKRSHKNPSVPDTLLFGIGNSAAVTMAWAGPFLTASDTAGARAATSPFWATGRIPLPVTGRGRGFPGPRRVRNASSSSIPTKGNCPVGISVETKNVNPRRIFNSRPTCCRPEVVMHFCQELYGRKLQGADILMIPGNALGPAAWDVPDIQSATWKTLCGIFIAEKVLGGQ